MPERNAPRKFLQGLATRDFEGMAASFTANAKARMLLPHGLEEHAGRESIVRRFEAWFRSASGFDLLSSNDEAVGDRHRVSFRLNLVRDGRTRELIEQVAFIDVGPLGIERMDLVCSGFLAEPGAGACPAQVFDAGDMGCADGLAQEFRGRIARVPVGGSLKVLVSDPAAKEDLPPLARLLGQRVTSIEAHDDGRLTITVEKRK
jgi:TusA-related sulfurtransferase